MNRSGTTKPNRHDLILAVVILAAAGVFALVIHLGNVRKSGTPAAFVTARVDGEEYGSWSLQEDQRIVIDTEYGHNVLVISDGEAFMSEADCPDGYCMQQRPISAEHPERTIVCLPHRLVISGDAAEGSSEKTGEDGTAEDNSGNMGGESTAGGSADSSTEDNGVDAVAGR